MSQDDEAKDRINKESESAKLNIEYSGPIFNMPEKYSEEFSTNCFTKPNYFQMLKLSFIIIFCLQTFTLHSVIAKAKTIENTPLIVKDNYIIAIYKYRKGEDMDILYPTFTLYLSDYDYIIYLIEDNFKPTFQRIENGEKAKSSGIKKFRVEFKFVIESMRKMFYRARQLLYMDFSHLITERINSMEKTFSNCYNLLDINFTNFAPDNLQNMELTFENCRNLTGLDLSSFNNKINKKLNNMNQAFVFCDSLAFVNLSNINLDLVPLHFDMFKNNSHLKLLILDSATKIKPYSEQVYRENADSNKFAIIANDKDLNSKNINYNCEIGEKEKCNSCNPDIKKKFQCEKCNDHYFIPGVVFPTKCKKCLLENCFECLDERNCAVCEQNYFLNKYNQCIDKCNITNGCSKCDALTNQCTTCSLGFFMPSDSLYNNTCQKCDVNNCKTCFGSSSVSYCTECYNRFTPIYENETVISCEPYKYGFSIDSSTGLETLNYYVKAVYYITDIAKYITLINDTSSITQMLIDNVEVKPIKFYKFYSVGFHTVYMNFNLDNLTNTDNLFFDVRYLKEIDFSPYFKTDKINSMRSMFAQCIRLEKINLANFNTENVKDMSYMFYNCRSLSSLDISNFKTKNTLNISGMFYQCEKLNELIGLEKINTENIERMDNLFHDCKSLEKINIDNFVLNPKVTSLSGFFYGCESLKSIDLSSLVTKNIKNMDSMFFQCSSLTEIDFSTFDTSSVEMMGSMFYNCSQLKEINISTFNTQNLIDMHWMFAYCTSLKEIDLSHSIYPKVENMAYLFYGCSSLEKIIMDSFKKDFYCDVQGMLYGINPKGYIRIFHEIYQEVETQVGMSWIKEVTVEHEN